VSDLDKDSTQLSVNAMFEVSLQEEYQYKNLLTCNEHAIIITMVVVLKSEEEKHPHAVIK